jgi:hypothetical protein
MAFVLSHQTTQHSSREITARASSSRQATPVPNSTVMKGGVTACLLIDCVAAIPWAGSNRLSPAIANVEKGKKMPATSPHRRAVRRDVEDAAHRQASSLLRRSISRSVGSSKANEPLWIRPAGR